MEEGERGDGGASAGGGGGRGTCDGGTKPGSLGGVGGLLEEPSRALARAKALRKVLLSLERLRRREAGEGRLESRRARVFVMVIF